MLRGIRPIAIRVRCTDMVLPGPVAASVGLIVNELVTNSLKYAYPEERGGIVEVEIAPRDEGGLIIRVTDNGAGCADDASGLGTRLVRLLAKQRGGSFERSSGVGGCESVAVVPDLS